MCWLSTFPNWIHDFHSFEKSSMNYSHLTRLPPAKKCWYICQGLSAKKKIEAKVMLNPADKNQSLIQIQLLEKIEENEHENLSFKNSVSNTAWYLISYKFKAFYEDSQWNWVKVLLNTIPLLKKWSMLFHLSSQTYFLAGNSVGRFNSKWK